MSEERKRILNMLAEGKISADEAGKLLDTISDGPVQPPETSVAEPGTKKTPSYMYVKVTSTDDDNVDVKVPLNLLRAGLRFTSLIPPKAMEHINTQMAEKGISFNLNNMKQEDVEELIQSLSDMEVNVNSKNGDKVRVYCA
ncbi:MAG: hypothetical protein GF350_11845 [Chitinivibrionales bacterium]|nr:hypothetical protein [Chitinivibrionales bacterium]